MPDTRRRLHALRGLDDAKVGKTPVLRTETLPCSGPCTTRTSRLPADVQSGLVDDPLKSINGLPDGMALSARADTTDNSTPNRINNTRMSVPPKHLTCRGTYPRRLSASRGLC